jgi:TRAP-type C4-dicarboxylate transport system permease small subunit
MKNWRRLAARLCGWIASVFLAAMMLLTVADIVLRFFFNRPIRGTYELVELLLACTFFFAMPASFLRDEHIVVDVIDGALPRAVAGLKRFAAAAAAVMLGVIAWQSWISAQDAIAFGDVTSDLSLPRILYWIPLLAGIGGAALAAGAMAATGDEKTGTDH